MKLFAVAGKLVGLALILVLILIGVGTPAGAAIIDPLGEAIQAIGRGFSANMPEISTGGFSGDTWAAVGIAALVLAGALLFGGKAMESSRTRIALVIGVVLLAVVLAQTNILG